ncbi:MAG TPA: hypothetical protein V6C81_12050 [Planktothrix sp.]|jgi:hypothetical protein
MQQEKHARTAIENNFFRTSERGDVFEMIATLAAALLLFVLGWQFGRASVKDHPANQKQIIQVEQKPGM